MKFFLLTGFALAAHLSAVAADWPHWRGPSRNGTTPEHSGWDGTRWNLAREAAWETDAGEGGSSPVVAGRLVFTLGWQADTEVVRALDLNTGAERWKATYPAPRHGRKATGDQGLYSGPSATPSADTANGRLFTLGADGDLRACRLDSGAPLWSVNLYERHDPPQRPKIGRSGRRDYGYTCAPLVLGDRVLVEVGAADTTLVALDAASGREVWRSTHAKPAGHAGGITPFTVNGIPCVAVLTTPELAVIRIDAGHEGETLATIAWETDFANNIVTPVAVEGSVILSSKYNLGMAARWAIHPGGAERLWATARGEATGVCTPVVAGKRLFWISQEAVCVGLDDGAVVWKGGAFGDAGSCLLTGDGLLVAWGGRGVLTLIDPAAKNYRALETRDLSGNADVWPHLALAQGHLLLKDRAGRLRVFTVSP